MFKWACLAVAVVFLAVVVWMLNDIRLQVRRSAGVIDTTGQTVNAELPAIVERTNSTSEVVSKNLPQVMDRLRAGTATVSDSLPRVVERVERTTEVVGELAEDIRQLKELAGMAKGARDKGVVAYAESVLKAIAASGGEIGVRKTVGRGLKNKRPAAEWVEDERREAALMAILGRSKKQMLQAITRTKLGFAWSIELPGQEPVRLLDWLRENHAETKQLAE
jgi:hypothetical protein